MKYLHISLDDADSHMGGCTTYVAYRLLKDLLNNASVDVVELPHLVRLNPYIPFKTRGNAAVKIVLKVHDNDIEKVIDLLKCELEKYAEHRGKASPGLAIFISDSMEVPIELRKLYYKAVTDVVTFDLVENVCRKFRILTWGGRGKIGAVAALGADFFEDSTFELLVYGDPSVKKRLEIPYYLVDLLDKLSSPLTFLNLDPEEESVLIMPAGPDPVIFGIRGDSAPHVMYMASLIVTLLGMEIEGWLLYRTNQGTEVHVEHSSNMMRTYRPVRRRTCLFSTERTPERHVVAEGLDQVWCYRHLGHICTELENFPGSVIDVWGSSKMQDYRYFIYVEGLRKLADRTVRLENPKCDRCGTRLVSGGRDLMRCPKCGYRTDKRKLVLPSYETCSCLVLPKKSEHRHLMKPVERVGLESLASMFVKYPLWIL